MKAQRAYAFSATFALLTTFSLVILTSNTSAYFQDSMSSLPAEQHRKTHQGSPFHRGVRPLFQKLQDYQLHRWTPPSHNSFEDTLSDWEKHKYKKRANKMYLVPSMDRLMALQQNSAWPLSSSCINKTMQIAAAEFTPEFTKETSRIFFLPLNRIRLQCNFLMQPNSSLHGNLFDYSLRTILDSSTCRIVTGNEQYKLQHIMMLNCTSPFRSDEIVTLFPPLHTKIMVPQAEVHGNSLIPISEPDAVPHVSSLFMRITLRLYAASRFQHRGSLEPSHSNTCTSSFLSHPFPIYSGIFLWTGIFLIRHVPCIH